MKNKLSNLAFVCVNFLRPECTKKCIATLKEHYPDIEIFMADQDNPTNEMKSFYKQYDVKVYWLPFDCGLAYSRNFLLDKIVKQKKYKYIMWGDNDFVFDDRNNIEHAIEILEKNEDVDIVGGAVEKNGRTMHYERQILFDEERGIIVLIPLEYTEPKEQKVGNILYYPCDLTFNYAIAKRKVFKDKKIRWHEKIKVKFEHLCIFLTFKKYGYKVVYCPSMRVIHNHVDPAEYKKYRYRTQDSKVFADHWKVKMSFTIAEGKYLYEGKFVPIHNLKRIKPIEIKKEKPNTKIKKFDLYSMLKLCLNNNIEVALAKETCYNAVFKRSIINERKNYIFTNDLFKLATILFEKDFKFCYTKENNLKIEMDKNECIVFNAYPIRTKKIHLYDLQINVPFPVLKYLREEGFHC